MGLASLGASAMLWRQRRRARGLGMKAEAWGKRCDALTRMKGLGCREDHALGHGNCLKTQGLRSWMVHVLRMSMRWRGGKGGRDDDAEHRCVCLRNVRREDFERWPGRQLQLERKRDRSLDILLRPIGQEEGQPDHDSPSARETAPGPTEFDTMLRYCLLGLEVHLGAR